ncbi:MAG: DUF3631 domain-containing protein [Magnetococcales bacterium]|nr:DUF3631 domain-containing protein [Magnetococcales bacterium]
MDDYTTILKQEHQEAILAQLAGLPTLEYDRVRQGEAKRFGCRVTTLDYLVSQRRKRNESTNGQGRAFRLESPKPWPEPVDGGELLADLARVLTRHVRMEPGCPTAVALWVLHTHAFGSAQISPRLAITSPEKRCGKSTLLTVLGGLVPKPLHVANVTAAAIFRTIEAHQPTLLIDEADTFLDGKEDLRGILNSGHNKATAFVIRVSGEELEPRTFTTWSPMAIAAIGKLPETLMDRSIIISMRRKLSSEKVERLRLDRMNHLNELARKAARWAADNSLRVLDQEPEVPDFLSDRAADNWRTLLAITDTVGGTWPERARRAIQELNGEPCEEDGGSLKETLLQDIEVIFAQMMVETIATEDLINRLIGKSFSHRPWATFDHGKPITPRGLANLLKPFGVRPKDFRIRGQVLKGYSKAGFTDAFSRYIPKQSATAATSCNINELNCTSSATEVHPVAHTSQDNLLNLNDVAHVADKSGVSSSDWVVI